MDDDTTDQAFAELKTRHLGGWGVAQIAVGTGLAVYAMWVGILQPGFRKVPLKLQVRSELSLNNILCDSLKRRLKIFYYKLFKISLRSHIFLPVKLK